MERPQPRYDEDERKQPAYGLRGEGVSVDHVLASSRELRRLKSVGACTLRLTTLKLTQEVTYPPSLILPSGYITE